MSVIPAENGAAHLVIHLDNADSVFEPLHAWDILTTEGRQTVPRTTGRHRAPASRANGRETPRKAAKRVAVRWLATTHAVWLRVWSPLRAQWFRVWPPLLGMVAGLLVDLGIMAIVWSHLTV
jgi:hypothetical protein